MNATSRRGSAEIPEKLPLGVAGMMEFELIALGGGRSQCSSASRLAAPREGGARATSIVGTASAKVINNDGSRSRPG